MKKGPSLSVTQVKPVPLESQYYAARKSQLTAGRRRRSSSAARRRCSSSAARRRCSSSGAARRSSAAHPFCNFKDIVSDCQRMQFLKDIVPAALNNINTKFIVLDKGRIDLEGQHKTCLALVADETAAVHFQMWGDECDVFEPGDIIRLENGIFSYIRNNRNNHVLRAGKRGKAEKVGEFTMAYVEKPNMSEIHWVPDPKNPKIYLPVDFTSHISPTH